MSAGEPNDVNTATDNGLRRMENKRIEVQSSVSVTFSKRRNSLIGKLKKFCNLGCKGMEAATATVSVKKKKKLDERELMWLQFRKEYETMTF
ncbi:hypothetical protein LINGRAHAP2_LOCUS21851 [Linum grandiflorum]